MDACGSTWMRALTRERAATAQAVSASISTPCALDDLGDRTDLDLVHLDGHVDHDPIETDGMTERDERRGLLGRLDSGEPSSLHRIQSIRTLIEHFGGVRRVTTAHLARATRRVSGLAVTSTMRA